MEEFESDIDVNEVIHDIRDNNSLLHGTTIDYISNIIGTHSENIMIQQTWKLQNPQLQDQLDFSKKHIQILGGYMNINEHWICIYYDGNQLHFYDSLGNTDFFLLHDTVQDYIIQNYSNDRLDIVGHKVTHQPDGRSCGVYASAFAITLALGHDPAKYQFSRNAIHMRNHLAAIAQSKILTLFPTSDK